MKHRIEKIKNSLENATINAGRDFHLGDKINIHTQPTYSETSKIPPHTIKQQFQDASHILSTYPNNFENLSNSHIERAETEILLQWIQKDLNSEEKPIALLIGDAGYGKSVILKDLWTKLQEEKDTVALGLKADGYYVESIEELEKQIRVGDDLEKMVATLAANNNKVVIIIDQIDALSLSLSANRSYLDTYKLLVRKLQHIRNVRIVISVRTYDLKYDPELNFFGNDTTVKKKEVKVSQLMEQNVNQVLRLLNPKMGKLPPNLLKLLQVPLHLDVFTKVYKSKINFASLRTLQDLYEELWKEKLLKIPPKFKAKSKKCIKLVYEMVKGTEITVAASRFENQYLKELDYLKSIQIIKEKEGKLQFFHQTFFDFVFAKQFVSNKSSIAKFLKKHNQGLLIRAKLKMIVNYLRKSDEPAYLKMMGKLIAKKDTRFHIKYLLISLLGFRNNPSSSEVEFAFEKLLSTNEFKNLFLEMALGTGWLIEFIEKGTLDELLNDKDDIFNHWFQILARKLPEEGNLILNYLSKTPDFTEKSNYIWRLLYRIEDWDNPIAKELFLKHKKINANDNFAFNKIIEKAANVDMVWALENYKPVLLESLKDIRKDHKKKAGFKHEDKSLMNHLFTVDSSQSFWFYFEILENIIEKSKVIIKDKPTTLFFDFAFTNFSVDSKTVTYEYYHIYQKLIEQLREEAKAESPLFTTFLKENINNNSETILKILAIGLASNSKPFIKDIFKFFLIYKDKGGFKKDNNLNYFIRELISESYPHLSKKQKEIFNKIILTVKCDSECRFYQDKADKKRMYQNNGLLQFRFIESIPENERINFKTVKNRCLELNRKFKDIPERKISKTRSIVSKVPGLCSNEQYQRLSLKNWENSFQKYGEDYERDYFRGDPCKGQHADEFKKQVAQRPEYFYPFVEKLIVENEIWKEYLIRGLQGLKDGDVDPEKFLKLYEKAIKIPFDTPLTIQLIQLVMHCIKAKIMSASVLEFLINNALTHPDPPENPEEYLMNEDSLKFDATGVRDIAINMITCIQFEKQYEDLIFDTLHEVVKDKSLKVRVSIMSDLKWLLNLNREKTLNILLENTKDNQQAIVRRTFDTAQYLAHDNLKALLPFFENATQYEENHENIAIILSLSWIHDSSVGYAILERLLKESDVAKSVLADVATRNLYCENGELNPKSEKLFYRNLSSDKELLQNSYSIAFNYLKVKDFPNIFHWLQDYAKSKAGKKHLHSYYDYLIKCSPTHPRECLELMQVFKVSEFTQDKERFGIHDDEPIKVIIGAYNALNPNKKEDQKYIEIAMQLFDDMLRNSICRKQAVEVLSQVEV